VIDRIQVDFDDPNLVANAGLLLVGTLVARLELERVVNSMVRLAGRVGGALPGRKVLTLVHAMVAGGSHIDHADVLRAGNTAGVLAHRVMAPSTLGTFLRAFSFGHVRQLEAVVGEVVRRAWALGAGPGSARLVIDVDSTSCEVEGHKKQGAAFGYTKVLGYHPILASRADTGEVLHARMRKGSANTARGVRRFIAELIARVRRAGATGKGVAATIAAIEEDQWRRIDYTPDGEAQVAECLYQGRRLIVRRTRLTDRHQARLWPDWRHFGFLTDLYGDAVEVDAFHRQHATVELDIRDLKEGAGMEHVPSGKFHANSAWLQCAVLAHNLIRWTAALGQTAPVDQRTVARTMRERLINIPGRLVNRAGTPVLRGPLNWPWRQWFERRLAALRILEPQTG
jgi:hypothetical protein